MLRCIAHLRQAHAGTGAGQPFRLVLVGYSMGGVVAREVVGRLAADPSFGELGGSCPALPMLCTCAAAPCRTWLHGGCLMLPPPGPCTPPPADLGQLVALVTLGSPTHFPRFMPHRPLGALLADRAAKGGEAGARGACTAAAAAVAAVPRANIVAGAADYFLPHTLGNMRAPATAGAEPELSLVMRDVPGVWTTCGHKVREGYTLCCLGVWLGLSTASMPMRLYVRLCCQPALYHAPGSIGCRPRPRRWARLSQGIVSCNQLVRQLVPLLVDATAASLQGGSTAERQAVIQQLLHRRLATDTAAAMAQLVPAADGEPAQVAAATPARSACGADVLEAAAAQHEPKQIHSPLLLRQALAGSVAKLAWNASEHVQQDGDGLLLLAHAAPPCSQWSVVATAAGDARQLAGGAAPLPPLLPRLQERWVPRHWLDLVHGVDWRQNATRLLYVPFTDAAGQQLERLTVTVAGGAGGAAVLAQVLRAHPLQQPLQLAGPGSAPVVLAAKHAAAVGLQLPHAAWPLGSAACDGSLSLGCLAQLLVGSLPPWNLLIRAQQCDRYASYPGGLLPAVVGLSRGRLPADAVRLAAGAVPGSASGGSMLVLLWDGMEAVGGGGTLLFISDPGCTYSLQ